MDALAESGEARIHRWWPFALLLLAGASRWIVSAAHPNADFTLASEAVGCAWATLLSLAFFSWRRKNARRSQASSQRGFARSLLGGAMIFGGPAVSLLIDGRELDASSLTIALALTPVVIAIASSALGTERSDGIAGRIWPGLAAVSGLLLVLVQPSLTDARGDLALVLAPALTGVGAALFCSVRRTGTASGITSALGVTFALGVTSALGSASALFALTLVVQYLLGGLRPSISLLAVACDGVVALLSIVSLMQLGATRWSSQFTWVPLLIVLESLVLVRPQLTAHWVVGLTLMALASIYLVLPAAEDANPSASPIPD